MIESLTRNWWLVALRGVAAILFGLIAFVRPGMTLTALVYVFGAYALIGGAFAIAAALWAAGAGQRFWALLFDGVLGIAAGDSPPLPSWGLPAARLRASSADREKACFGDCDGPSRQGTTARCTVRRRKFPPAGWSAFFRKAA